MRHTIDQGKTCERIKELCRDKGIDAEHLSSLMNLSKQAVYSWFNGRKLPSIDHMVELADILGVTVDEMLVRRELQ